MLTHAFCLNRQWCFYKFDLKYILITFVFPVSDVIFKYLEAFLFQPRSQGLSSSLSCSGRKEAKKRDPGSEAVSVLECFALTSPRNIFAVFAEDWVRLQKMEASTYNFKPTRILDELGVARLLFFLYEIILNSWQSICGHSFGENSLSLLLVSWAYSSKLRNK